MSDEQIRRWMRLQMILNLCFVGELLWMALKQ